MPVRVPPCSLVIADRLGQALLNHRIEGDTLSRVMATCFSVYTDAAGGATWETELSVAIFWHFVNLWMRLLVWQPVCVGEERPVAILLWRCSTCSGSDDVYNLSPCNCLHPFVSLQLGDACGAFL